MALTLLFALIFELADEVRAVSLLLPPLRIGFFSFLPGAFTLLGNGTSPGFCLRLALFFFLKSCPLTICFQASM